VVLFALGFGPGVLSYAQSSSGNSGTIRGSVVDPSGAAIPRHRRRFERSVSWTRRSRVELVLVDGQPITDQQSKVFSNQIPLDSVQSMEVIEGAPPAEYGDKTSVVIVVTTRSGLGVTQPHGDVDASYGSFGTGGGGFNLAYGGNSWGNFIAANG
jgi:hypothetical protein